MNSVHISRRFALERPSDFLPVRRFPSSASIQRASIHVSGGEHESYAAFKAIFYFRLFFLLPVLFLKQIPLFMKCKENELQRTKLGGTDINSEGKFRCRGAGIYNQREFNMLVFSFRYTL